MDAVGAGLSVVHGGEAPAPDSFRPPNCEVCGAEPEIPALLTMNINVPQSALLTGPNGQPLPPRIDGALLFRPVVACPRCRAAIVQLVRSVIHMGRGPADAEEPAATPLQAG